MADTRIKTETELVAGFTASGGVVPPTPYTYVSIDGVALGAVTPLDNGWELVASQTGTDLTLVVDQSTNTTIVGLPGFPPYNFDTVLLELLDANNVKRHIELRLEARFEYVAPPVPIPQGTDDAQTIDAGTNADVDVLANDASDPAYTVVGTVLHGTPPAALTVTPSAVAPFSHNVAVASGTAAGDLDYDYCIDYGGGVLSDPITVTITVNPVVNLGDVYYEARDQIAGATFAWNTGSGNGADDAVVLADGTVLATGQSGTLVVPPAHAGETYYVVRQTGTIAARWNIITNSDDTSSQELHVVDENIGSLIITNPQTRGVYFPNQTYPLMRTFTLNTGFGSSVAPGAVTAEFLGTYPFSSMTANLNLQSATSLHFPDASQVPTAGASFRRVSIIHGTQLVNGLMTYHNLRGGGDPTDVTDATVQLPANSTYEISITVRGTHGVAFEDIGNYATVAVTSTNFINFGGALPDPGTHFAFGPGEETNPYSADFWMIELVNAGRDTTNFASISGLGDMGGDNGGYGGSIVYSAAGQAAADALAGTPFGTPPTQWDFIPGGDFRT